MKTTITYNGATYVYPSGNKLLNYDVVYMPNGDVVLHLGDALSYSRNETAYHMGPYHVKHEDDAGVVKIDGDMPRHIWGGRIALRFKQLTVKNDRLAVMGKWSFPMGDTGMKVGAFPDYTHNDVPFDITPTTGNFIGITFYMPTTGERPDIGLKTDASARFVLTGDARNMVVWAKAGTYCPNKFRDKTTGKVVNLATYKKGNAYDAPGYQGDPWFDKGPTDAFNGSYHVYGGGWGPQQAHYCDMHFLAAVVFEDPIFLMDLEYAATFCMSAPREKQDTNGFPITHGEYRGTAWGLGVMFKTWAATKHFESKGILPSESLGSAHWKEHIDRHIAFYNATAAGAVFNLLEPMTTIGPWQHDYLLTVLADGILYGLTELIPPFLKLLKFAISLSDGKSGWTGYGGPYYIDLYDNNGVLYPTMQAMLAGFLKTELENVATAAAHGANYTPQITQAQYDKLVADPLNGGKAMTGNEYLMTRRSVLVMAKYLVRKGAIPPVADLDLAYENVQRMQLNYGSTNPRQSYVDQDSPPVLPGSPAPQPIPPLPTPQPEEPPVSNPGTDPLAALKIATDAVAALVPRVQSAVDTLEAQIAALKDVPAGNGIDATALAAVVAKLEAARNGLAAAVEDAATPG